MEKPKQQFYVSFIGRDIFKKTDALYKHTPKKTAQHNMLYGNSIKRKRNLANIRFSKIILYNIEYIMT